MTTVGELCNRTVWIARADEPVLEAARRMRDQHVGCLVVVEARSDGRTPVAIVTDRDLVVRAMAARPRELERLRLADVASDRIVVAREREPIVDAVARMRAHGIRRLPVVDGSGLLQGIVTLDDLLEHLADQIGELSRLLHREQQRERDITAAT